MRAAKSAAHRGDGYWRKSEPDYSGMMNGAILDDAELKMRNGENSDDHRARRCYQRACHDSNNSRPEPINTSGDLPPSCGWSMPVPTKWATLHHQFRSRVPEMIRIGPPARRIHSGEASTAQVRPVEKSDGHHATGLPIRATSISHERASVDAQAGETICQSNRRQIPPPLCLIVRHRRHAETASVFRPDTLTGFNRQSTSAKLLMQGRAPCWTTIQPDLFH